MRLWLRIPTDGLRRALADLLAGAGHDVSTAPVPPQDPDLQILLQADQDPPLPDRPALFLRPGAGRPPAPDPAAALTRVLESGGVAVWAPPLDPALLVGTLGTATRHRRPEDDEPWPALAASPYPWMLLDPRARVVVWANAPARERCGLRGREAAPVPDGLPSALLARAEGREQVTVAGRRSLAVWWSEREGRRCLGLLDLPAAVRGDADGNVRALADIGRMTATFAHEVRNPIASLAGAVDLLREELTPAERKEVADLAKERLSLMRRLLDDMLRLARPLRGDPEAFEVTPLVDSVVASTRTDPLFAGIRLEVDPGPPGLRVRAHPQALRQAVLNLLINAAEAQEGAGVIRLSVLRSGDLVSIRVEDDGPGIPPERRETVFDPFWTTKPRGTGLGLALVRRVAEAAGGAALVEDSPGGARVRMDVPAADGPP